MTLSGIRKMPEDDYLEAMFRAQVERHPGLKEDIAYYERLPQGHADKSYTFLLSAARRYIEHKRNQKVKIERARTGGKPSAAVADNRPPCFAFQQGKCQRGHNCKYRHDRGKGMGASPKPQKKGSGKSTSPSPSDKSHVCSFYLKGKCTKGESCSFKHPRP